jgi:3-hydroxyisobutyrate dehydrogenase
MRVGYIGLGSQGAPMARRIIGAGYETTLWARRAATLEPFEGLGATFAETPAELAAASDLVCLCVVNDADVEQVIDDLLPALAPGSVIAVQSTVRPETCVALAARARERDITVIDAPVSGGAPA